MSAVASFNAIEMICRVPALRSIKRSLSNVWNTVNVGRTYQQTMLPVSMICIYSMCIQRIQENIRRHANVVEHCKMRTKARAVQWERNASEDDYYIIY